MTALSSAVTRPAIRPVNDSLSGGSGNDRIFGGDDRDRLSGGSGADRFHFDTALDASANVDIVTDFAVADDTIMLDRAVFSAITDDGPLAASAFHAGAAAGDADDRIIYNSASGNIFYDADGLGGDAQVLFARVTPGTALTRLDFLAYSTAAAAVAPAAMFEAPAPDASRMAEYMFAPAQAIGPHGAEFQIV